MEKEKGNRMENLRDFVLATGWRETGFYVRGTGHFIISEREPDKYADFGEIFWCIAGCGKFRAASGIRYDLLPGNVWYYPPRSQHVIDPQPAGFNYRWLSIDGSDAGMLFKAMKIRPGINPAGACPEQLFANIELELQNTTSHSQMRALTSAFEILTMITAPQTEKRPMLEKIRTLIHKNYAMPDLNVARIADLFHIHRVTLSRTFKQAYGISPGDYLNSIRLQAGIRLLKESCMSIKDIAAACGYSSGSYFGKVLMFRTGYTPKHFRKMMK